MRTAARGAVPFALILTSADFNKQLDAEKTGGVACRAAIVALANQHGAAIYVEDLAGDEAGIFGAQKQHRGRNLLGSTHAPQRNSAADFFAASRIIERGLCHIGIDPT